MTHHVGFLYADYGGGIMEIFNHARTLEHLRNSAAGCSRITIMGDECEVLSKDPCDGSPLVFTTPSANDTAPWWDGVANSASSKAYGFWVEEWTGLDDSHLHRTATTISPRGAKFSTLGQGARTMKFNVLLFGHDGVALEELFRWLAEQITNCCDDCGGTNLWVRTTCPDGYSDDYGLATLNNVQMVEGLTWLDPPIRDLGCFMRRATFTLAAGDPCMYTPPSQLLAPATLVAANPCTVGFTNLFGAPCSPENLDIFSPYWQMQVLIPAATRGVRAPIVYLTQSGEDWSPPLVITGTSDPNSRGATMNSVEISGRVFLRGVPPGYEVMVDCARRRVLKRVASQRLPWESADDLIDTLRGIPSWPFVTCWHGYTFVTPTFFSVEIANLTVSIDETQRYGCC